MTGTDSDELVRRARRGDREAFSDLILQNEGMLSRVAMSILKDPEDGADAVQEAVFAAWRRLPQLRFAGHFKTWLTKILIRSCYSLLEQREKHSHGELEAALDKAEEQGDLAAAMDLRTALSKLGENDRLILSLYYCDGFSVREIAGLLKLSESAVKQRIHRGRTRLRTIYGEQEGICHES